MQVQLFIPCFIDQYFPQTGLNMVRVLEKAGCSVAYNRAQTCCGQVGFNAGYREDAREVAERFLQQFGEEQQVIVAPSASCTAFIRRYYHDLFANTPYHNQYRHLRSNLYEFSEFLTEVHHTTDTGARLNGKAVYHDACAALHGCGISASPRRLLREVKELELLDTDPQASGCCGFGGLFAVKYEPIATDIAMRQLNKWRETGADYLISTEASCLMHLQGYIEKQGYAIRPLHIADVLASGW